MRRTKVSRIDKLTFGKYKGVQLRSVIDVDPQYIYWCLATIKWFSISKRANNELREALIRLKPKRNYNKTTRKSSSSSWTYNDRYEYSYMDRDEDAELASAMGIDQYGY